MLAVIALACAPVTLVAAIPKASMSDLVRGMENPPAVEPSWTTKVSLSVSTVTSRTAPVKDECSEVVPPRSCSFLLIMIDLQSLVVG